MTAFEESLLQVFRDLLQEKKYLVTYNERKKRAYVVLKEAATSEDVMEGAFQVCNCREHWMRFSPFNELTF